MHKKILYYMMLAGSVTRVVSSMLLAFLGKIHLPALLVILSLAIAAIGIALVAKSFWSQIRLPELVTYHVAADLGAAISFIVLHFYMVDISLIETLITGSVLSILASVIVLFLTFRKKRYVTIRQQKQLALEQRPALTVKEAVK